MIEAEDDIRSKTFTIELTTRPDLSGPLEVKGLKVREKLETILNTGLQIGIEDFLIWLNVYNAGNIYESAFTIELCIDTYARPLDIVAALQCALEDDESEKDEDYFPDLLVSQINTQLVSMRPPKQ